MSRPPRLRRPPRRGARTVEVFAYFNSDWAGYAVENALYLENGIAAAQAA
jgi:hypothetical protein